METTPLPLGIIIKVVCFGIPGLIWLILAIRRYRARQAANKPQEVWKVRESTQEEIDAMMGTRPQAEGKYFIKNEIQRK